MSAPATTMSPSPGTQPATTNALPSASADLSGFQWYEAWRVHDMEGMETRSLLFGSLDGTLGGELPLGSIFVGDRRGGSEPFAWIDPQADGVFDGQALVWGRDGALGRIEVVDLASGSVRTIVDTQDVVHVATADSSLANVYFLTADESTGEPSGLWLLRLSEGAEPIRLPYEFADEPVHSFAMYRMVANGDGSLLAVQFDGREVTVVDVANGTSYQVDPGGPFIGFAADHPIGFGGQSAAGYSLIALGPPGSTGQRQLLTGVSSAQVARTGQDGLVAAMTTAGNTYEIHAIVVATGAVRSVYGGDAGSNPLLANIDPKLIGYESPPDTVLLGEHFNRFIGTALPGRELPESAFPLLLNLRSGEAIRLGPFDGD